MKALKNKKGMTLVELIVAFALLSVFLASAVGVLTASMGIFKRSISMSHAQTVGAMLLDDIIGHIGKASSELEYNDHAIAFQNAKGDREIIYVGTEGVDKDQLCIHYDEDTNTKRKAVNWRYPKNTYMNNKMTEMKVEKIEGKTENQMLFRITIYLENERTGYQYHTSQMVECYYSKSELNAKLTDIECKCEEKVKIR